MKAIPFTQYMRPDGRPVPRHIDRPDAVVEQADHLIAIGYRFEAEVLTTGAVSLTVTDGDDDIACELVDNGPAVPSAVDRLVETATRLVEGGAA